MQAATRCSRARRERTQLEAPAAGADDFKHAAGADNIDPSAIDANVGASA